MAQNRMVPGAEPFSDDPSDYLPWDENTQDSLDLLDRELELAHKVIYRIHQMTGQLPVEGDVLLGFDLDAVIEKREFYIPRKTELDEYGLDRHEVGVSYKLQTNYFDNYLKDEE